MKAIIQVYIPGSFTKLTTDDGELIHTFSSLKKAKGFVTTLARSLGEIKNPEWKEEHSNNHRYSFELLSMDCNILIISR